MSIVRYVLDMSSAHCAPYESATCRSNRQKSRSSCARRRATVRELRRRAALRRIARACTTPLEATAPEVLREECASPRGEGAGVRAAEDDPRRRARDAGQGGARGRGAARRAHRGALAIKARRGPEKAAVVICERLALAGGATTSAPRRASSSTKPDKRRLAAEVEEDAGSTP